LDPTTEHRFVSTGKQEFPSFFVHFSGRNPYFPGIKVLHEKLPYLILFSSHGLLPERQGIENKWIISPRKKKRMVETLTSANSIRCKLYI